MTEPEEIDEDLFADLYDGDERAQNAESIPTPDIPSTASQIAINQTPNTENDNDKQMLDVKDDPGPEFSTQEQYAPSRVEPGDLGQDWHTEELASSGVEHLHSMHAEEVSHTGIKEDGKMFIGGLNWETTDQSLKDYFSQFGEVQECTVMRDGATGRSRGFGFLTFEDPRTVNIVMVKEHFLDGKIIDPKRAIPRDEQERTSKIFVGGVSSEASEQDFKEYFMQYGRVVDATLMMDKDTGRPRGFGFVTFDSEAAVDATLQGDLTILGKPIEVKKAQPRGNMREDEEQGRRGQRRGGKEERFREDHGGGGTMNQIQNQGTQGYTNGMTPQMMAQWFARMQQMMQMMNAAQGGQMVNPMGMGAMNPTMMQQYQQMQRMQQYQQMQAMQQMQQGHSQDSQSPGPSNAGNQGVNLQQIRQMSASSQGQGAGNFTQIVGIPTGPSTGGGNVGGGAIGAASGRGNTPGYNAQDQLMFEQQKYEQQQARRGAQDGYQQGGPTSWEGMYDDVPQPNMGGAGSTNRGGSYGRGGGNKSNVSKALQPSAPANAPTGPKNAGVPGANYRGGGRGSHRGYHPYRR